MDVLINVVGQKLKIETNNKVFVSGSREFIRFVFNTDSTWDDLTAFAQFIQNGTPYSKFLDSENATTMPPEIREGDVELTLHGSGGDVVATTNSVTLKIKGNVLIVDESSTGITLTLYEQLVNKMPRLNEEGIIIFG